MSASPPEKPKILIVDDKPQNLYALEKLLQSLDVETYPATSGNDALGLAVEHDFCLAIVDVQMPEMDGYELVELLRGSPATAHLPVIFVSAIFSDEYHHRKGYDAGAVDFLTKPFVPEILLSKVRVFIALYRQRQELQAMVNELHAANLALERRAMQLHTSNRVGRQVTAILDLDELLRQVVQQVAAGFRSSLVAIWLLDTPGQAAVLSACTGGSLLPGHRLPLDGPSLVAQALRTGKTALLNDISAARLTGEPPAVGSELALPFIIQKETLGVLAIQSERRHAFRDDDLTALETIADQVAIALRNARLYAQVVAFNEQLEATVQMRTHELDQAYRRLEKLDQAKTSFISIMAHELRTPLTLIRGYTSILEGMVAAVPGAPEMVANILRGEGRLTEVVNSVLDVSRIDNATLQVSRTPVDLLPLFISLRAEHAPSLAERRLNLELVGLDDLPALSADPDLLEKLFQNLVLNAIKYTPDGGCITVTARLDVLDEWSRPLAGADQPGGLPRSAAAAVHVAVADTGIGIDPEQQELIFERFYQTGSAQHHSTGKTKFKGGGPGLGLAIARGIVAVHGGRIWVESPGHDEQACPGSTFHVVLPLAPAP